MVRKRGKGRAVRRARQKFGTYYENEDLKNAPHSMVIHRGHVDKDVRELVHDVRKVMEPFTASELAASKKNNLRDFVAIAGPLHVTHLLVFTQTEHGDYMKIVRMPRGPTLHFKLVDYSLRRDVLDVLKRKHTHQKQFLTQPLLVLNGFGAASKAATSDNNNNDEETNGAAKVDFHYKLLATTLQNMFPSINVTKVNLEEIRRCVLFNYNKEDGTIDFRQYYIRLLPVGLSKPVKKLVKEDVPDLSKYQDISEFIEKGGLLSESEAELDGPENEVEVKKEENKGAAAKAKTTTTRNAIRLSEIGPRLKLKLIKIEEGMCDGEILYHSLVSKTPEEINELRLKNKNKKKLKVKIPKKDEKSKGSDKRGMKRKREEEEDDRDDDDEDDDDDNDFVEDNEENDEKPKNKPFKIGFKKPMAKKGKFLRFSGSRKNK